MMIRKLLLLVLVVFCAELLGIIIVGKWIGAWYTLGLILFTTLIGLWLAKKEGLQTLQLLRLQLSRHEVPRQSLLDGVCILAGSILLITPGFLTDLIGFLLLFPYTRGVFKAWLFKKLSALAGSGNLNFMIFRRK